MTGFSMVLPVPPKAGLETPQWEWRSLGPSSVSWGFDSEMQGKGCGDVEAADVDGIEDEGKFHEMCRESLKKARYLRNRLAKRGGKVPASRVT